EYLFNKHLIDQRTVDVIQPKKYGQGEDAEENDARSNCNGASMLLHRMSPEIAKRHHTGQAGAIKAKCCEEKDGVATMKASGNEVQRAHDDANYPGKRINQDLSRCPEETRLPGCGARIAPQAVQGGASGAGCRFSHRAGRDGGVSWAERGGQDDDAENAFG